MNPSSLLGKRSLPEDPETARLHIEIQKLHCMLDAAYAGVRKQEVEELQAENAKLKARLDSLKVPVRRMMRARLEMKKWLQRQDEEIHELRAKEEQCPKCRPVATGGCRNPFDHRYYAAQAADVEVIHNVLVQNFDLCEYDSDSASEQEDEQEQEQEP